MTAGRTRPMPPQPDVDIRQIIQEAQNRWLRPIEVCEILRNYRQHNFKLNPVPPVQPQSGSLFLFDRKTLRYFRKDGHNWRKKKDGKTVREAHERLKAGSIDVLHCYYAHGEENPNFQRRAYWMLDTAYEHIVLVHYREVTENNRSCILRNMHEYGATERTTNASNSSALQPPSSHFTVSSMNISSSMASPETVDMPGTSHSPELDDVDSAEPDESEEAVPEMVEEQQGLQPSLLEQLTDRHQVPGIRSQLGSEPWQSSLRNSNGLAGVDGQVNPGLFPPQEDFKPSFSDLQQISQRLSPSSNFTHSGDVNSISRQFADILDSPGSLYSLPHQTSSASNALDLSAWNNLMVNGRGNGNGVGSYVKPELNSSPWAQMLEQVTTPVTRNRLLEGAGLTQPGLRLSPLGKDSSHSIGSQVSPKGKGIADALSPRNLGREPQTPLEADLRDVTEKNILKEAEERARNRWQTAHSDASLMDIANQRIQSQSGAQQMNVRGFGEPDTLGALVRSGQSPQDSGGLYSKESPRSQPGQASNVTNGQSQNQFEYQYHQGNSRFHQDENMHLTPPPPQQNIFDNSWPLSPTVELLLKDVRSEEMSNLDIMESYKKLGSFGKLDSFGRWMNSTDDISEIPVGGTSTSLWGYQEDAMSGVTQQMEEGEGIEPSVSAEQLFDIIDFSPEWGSSTEDTKVIICGSFLKDSKFSDCKWCCMFGAVEVPVELVGEGTLRCIAPPQEPGPVYFYITCNDRQARSQVRKFHYRSLVVPSNESTSSADYCPGEETNESLLLKIRLSRMLFGHATTSNNSRIGSRTQTFEERDNDEWTSLEDMVNAQEKPLVEVKEQLLQVVFKHRLEEWLQLKAQMQDGRGASVLDDRGQGVPHFTAALGYVWSTGPLSTSDIPINFRDAAGWTALHWAAKYGREKMVVALLEAGAAPVLSSDPSHKNPRGETAADLASAGGHGGIAGFLAEKSLTERLSGLTINEGVLNEIDKMTANLEGEKAVALLARRTSITRSVRAAEDEVRLRTSLEAVRTSAHAAALIQSAFRQHSFQRRAQLEQYKVDEYGLSAAEMQNFVAASKIQQAFRGHQKHKIKNLAAIRIQQKFRGWKGRKEFQTIRQRIIKLQAHVRGRLVRNRFRKIIWSVSIVEKVVLRWLRKRKGLRGFVQPKKLAETEGNEDLIKEGRDKQKEFVEEEVEKVRLMARQKTDREQYSRMVEEERRTSASKGEMHEYMTSSRDYME